MCSLKRMSTTPEQTDRADDQLVTHLSHWLTRQIGNDELLRKVQRSTPPSCRPGGRTAIAELLTELRRGGAR